MPQALGRPFEPVAGRWFAASVATLGLSCLQLLHKRRQPLHLLALRGELGCQFSDPGFGLWRHASRRHLLRKSTCPAAITPASGTRFGGPSMVQHGASIAAIDFGQQIGRRLVASFVASALHG
jgi:hypothetical protein